MNRSRRILARAQALGPVNSPCSGYESEESSPAHSITESLDIDFEFDDMNKDPCFIPLDNNTSSSESENEDVHVLQDELEYQKIPEPSKKIRILSNVKLFNEPGASSPQISNVLLDDPLPETSVSSLQISNFLFDDQLSKISVSSLQISNSLFDDQLPKTSVSSLQISNILSDDQLPTTSVSSSQVSNILSDDQLPTTSVSSSQVSKLPNPIHASVSLDTLLTCNSKKKKRTNCKFCHNLVTNFERHLERNHTDCKEVIDMLSYPKANPERKKILSLIRSSGNFNEYLKGNLYPKYGRVSDKSEYYPCHRCKALLKKSYLSRHRKTCLLNKVAQGENTINKFSEAAASQTLIACSLDENNTLHKLRVKEEVFPRMKADDISFVAKTDYLICKFGENYLKKHKREQLNVVCSNKMRELARFLIDFRKNSNLPNYTLKDVLTPRFFDTVIECAKNVGGYDKENKTYRAASLSAHLGTSLKQVCDLFLSILLKEDPCVPVTKREELIKETKRFKQLIETQWTTEISSLAFKTLQEQRWKKPVILPLTSDIKKFKEHVIEVADKAVCILKENPNNKKEFKNLVEASLALTVLFNRRRIGDVQYTHLTTYTNHEVTENQEECENALSETEKILAKCYKRLVTGGKGSRPIAILLPIKVQEYITFFIDIRMNYGLVPNDNPYLFGCPGTTKWTRGDVIIKKFAEKAGLQNPSQISSNRLRKQIATVMQILNMTNDELDQFSQFMGHTEKTHNEFYKLPQDVYQTAKVSKLLLLMEQGAEKYKGKALKDIDIDPHKDVAEEDSDEEPEIGVVSTKEILKLIPEKSTAKEKPEKPEPSSVGRTKWNQDQIKLLKTFFAKHIVTKTPPKKQECLEIINKHPDILYNKDWVRVKTFIYNCYRLKK